MSLNHRGEGRVREEGINRKGKVKEVKGQSKSGKKVITTKHRGNDKKQSEANGNVEQ